MAENEGSRKKLEHFASLATKYRWCVAETRRQLERLGLHVLPTSFYSPVPTVDEIRSSFEYSGAEPPYAAGTVFDRQVQLSYLELLMPYSSEFEPPGDDDAESPRGYFWSASTFGYSDAMAYYCVLRHTKPRTVIEVGSGFSTLIALEALRRNGAGELVCIEPFPRPFLRGRPGIAELIEQPVQELSPDWFRSVLRDGDVLFIDSTHTVKTGSDCLHLYLRVLPALDAALSIHAHDVFLPEGYPQKWLLEKHIYWTEQYLLYALLLENPRLRVLFGSNWHRLYNRPALEAFMGGKALAGGGSLWFERLPR